MTRSFKRQRGYLTFAQNGQHDYLRMAYGLALSLRATQRDVPHLSVAITPGMAVPERYREVFDEVINIPWLDEARRSDWKLENEWKAFHCTPYEHTVKLDADMVFTTDVSDWWDLLATQDVFFCTQPRTYANLPITSDAFRKCFTANRLPNIYTAFSSFRWTDPARELFEMAEHIFHNWQRFFELFLEPQTRPRYVSTDVVFALATRLMDCEADFTHTAMPYPSFVHMKAALQGWQNVGEDWTRHVPVTLTEDLVLKIARERQVLPVHYHDKAFLTDHMISTYEKVLGIA